MRGRDKSDDGLSSGSDSDSSSSSSSDNDSEASYELEKRMFLALQRKDVEGAIDVIEEDELEVCKRNKVKPPKGVRKKSQVSKYVNYEDAYGQTPLVVACKFGAQRLVVGLLMRGANANYESKLGITPLIACCQCGNLKAAKSLLNTEVTKHVPAAVNYHNKDGKTAFDFLSGKLELKMKPLLEEYRDKQSPGFVRKVEKREQYYLLKRRAGDLNGSDESDYITSSDEEDFDVPIRKRLTVMIQDKLIHQGRLQRRFAQTAMKGIKQRLTQAPKQQKHDAAMVIQTFVRKYLARKHFHEAVKRLLANDRYQQKLIKYALKIQRIYRGTRAKKVVKKLLQQHRMATRIQKVFRGYVERRDKAFLEDQKQKGKKVWLEREKRRGWMGAYAKRAVNVEWERAAHRAAIILVKHARRKLFRKRVEHGINQKQGAITIQRYVRGMLVRNPERVRSREFQYSSIETRSRLQQAIVRIKPYCSILSMKQEKRASQTLHKYMRPFLDRIMVKSNEQERINAAIRIQTLFRFYQAQKIGKYFRSRQKHHIDLVENCLSVQPLMPKMNKGKTVIGNDGIYGHCGKCHDCGKFEARPNQEHICNCGHHIVNHVLGNFRSGLDNRKIKMLDRKFYSNLGVITSKELEDALVTTTSSTTKAWPISSPNPDNKELDCIYQTQKTQRLAEKQKREEEKLRVEKVVQEINEEWKLEELLIAQKRDLMQELKARQDEENHLKLLIKEKNELKKHLEKCKHDMHMQRNRDIAEQRRQLRAIRRLKMSPIKVRKNNNNINSKGVSPTNVEVQCESEVLPGLPTVEHLVTKEIHPQQQEEKQEQRRVERDDDSVVRQENLAKPISTQTDPEEEHLLNMIQKLDARCIHRGIYNSKKEAEDDKNKPICVLQLVCEDNACELPREILIDRTPIVLGRGGHSDVLLDSQRHPKMVSKVHCILHIEKDKQQVRVVDLKSTNGTLVNYSLRVSTSQRATMVDGDILTLGSIHRFHKERSSEVSYRIRFPAKQEKKVINLEPILNWKAKLT